MERPDVVDDEEVNLARNLAAAFISARTGIGLAYARKTYADQPVGDHAIFEFNFSRQDAVFRDVECLHAGADDPFVR